MPDEAGKASAPSFSLLWGLLLRLVGGLSTDDQPTPPPPHLSREGGEEERRAEDGGEGGGRGERGDLSGRRGGVGGAVEGGLALQGGRSVGRRGCARGPPVVGRDVLLGVRCRGSAVGGPREVIRGTLAAIREGTTEVREVIRGAGWVYGGGTPRRGLCPGLVQGGSSMLENIEDMPYHALCPVILCPCPQAHRMSYPHLFS